MELMLLIIAGIAGTFVMTLFMNLASLLTGFNLHVPRILGTLITFGTRPSGATSKSWLSILCGNIAHYLIGILFAMLYHTVFLPRGISSAWGLALLFGAVAGLVAVLFWALTLKIHPLAPAVKLKLYLPLIFVAHLLFAAGMHVTLQLIKAPLT